MIFQNFDTIYCVKVLKNRGPQCDHRGFLQDIYVPINEKKKTLLTNLKHKILSQNITIKLPIFLTGNLKNLA